jgi:hypothetical protein
MIDDRNRIGVCEFPLGRKLEAENELHSAQGGQQGFRQAGEIVLDSKKQINVLFFKALINKALHVQSGMRMGCGEVYDSVLVRCGNR